MSNLGPFLRKINSYNVKTDGLCAFLMIGQILFGQGEELMSFVRGYSLLRVSTFQTSPGLYFYEDQGIPTLGNKVYLP